MAAGTITGKDARVYFASHNTGAGIDWSQKANNSYLSYSLADFSLTFSRDTVTQGFLGTIGTYGAGGALTLEGSFSIYKFGGGQDMLLKNLVDCGYYQSYTKLLAISGAISTSEAGYLSWYLTSCQLTGYDITIGDTGTLSNASLDFIYLTPVALHYVGGCIKG
jgi:hypothetical protein